MQKLPEISIKVIPHRKQRYPTAGDYVKEQGKLTVYISKLSPKHEFLIAIHELIEWFLIEQKGITIDSIDKFDIEFERKRTKDSLDEPGDDPKAPYYDEHQFATGIEKILADKLGVNWHKYSEHVNKL